MSKRKDTRSIKAEIVMHEGRTCIRFTTEDNAVVNFYLDAVKSHIETFKGVLNALKAYGNIATAAECLRAIAENSLELSDGCDHETIMKAEWDAVADIIEKHAAGKPAAAVKWSIKGIDTKITTDDKRAIIAMLERANPSFTQIDSNLKRVYELTENGNIHGYMYKRKDAASPWNLEKDVEVSFAKAAESLMNCCGAVAALKTIKETGVSIYKFNHYQQKKLKETVWYTISNASENKATLKIETEDATLEKAFTWKKTTAIESSEPVAVAENVAEKKDDPLSWINNIPMPSKEEVAAEIERAIMEGAEKERERLRSEMTEEEKRNEIIYNIITHKYEFVKDENGKEHGVLKAESNDESKPESVEPVAETTPEPVAESKPESVEPVVETTPEPVAESVEPVAETAEPITETTPESSEPVAEIISYGKPARIICGELTTAEKRAVARIMTEKTCTVEDAENSYHLGYNNTLEITNKASGETAVKSFTIKIETEKPTPEPVAESKAESVEPIAETTPEPVAESKAESVEPIAETTPEPVAESKAVKAKKPRKKKETAESPVLEYTPYIPAGRGVVSLDTALWDMSVGYIWSGNKETLEKLNYEKGAPIITLSERTGGFYPRETILDAIETFEKLEKDFSLESGMIWETLKAGKNIYCKKDDGSFNYNDKRYSGTIKSTYIYDSNAKIMTVITWLQAITWKKAKKVETRYDIPSYVGYSNLTISNQLIA